jgi:hypothetical protein
MSEKKKTSPEVALLTPLVQPTGSADLGSTCLVVRSFQKLETSFI